MAFTFQINSGVQFIHDEAMLSMAEVNHPQIKKTDSVSNSHCGLGKR